ncbi:hypothetical protein [Paracoccus sp. KR1-242]
MGVTGWPVRTTLRGRTIMVEGVVTGPATAGNYVDRGLSESFATEDRA